MVDEDDDFYYFLCFLSFYAIVDFVLVLVKGTLSDVVGLRSGVCKGTSFGPLLFYFMRVTFMMSFLHIFHSYTLIDVFVVLC